MAKDAKGHGSEGKGMSAAEEAQNRSGISWAKHARANFEGRSLASRDPIQNSDRAAAATLAGGHPKSAPVAPHSAMSQRDLMSNVGNRQAGMHPINRYLFGRS
jgi:hypothetical protein